MPHPRAVPRTLPVVRVALLAILGLGLLLTWSEWWPHALGGGDAGASRATDAALTGTEAAPSGAYLAAGFAFGANFLLVTWPALLGGLVVAAAVDSLVPRGWLLRLFGDRRRPYRSAFAGALLGSGAVMSSCTAVPSAVALRRRGVPLPGAVAFWVAAPMLNPVALAVCLLLLPWEWAVLRFAAGLAIVLFAAWYFARVAAPATMGPGRSMRAREPISPRDTVLGFARSLSRLARMLVPDYVILVFAIGIVQAWVQPSWWAGPLLLVAILAAVLGALLVIPTAGEAVLVRSLHDAGASTGAVGALLVTLPALSLPALLMLRGTVAPRRLAALTAAVIAVGTASGAILAWLGA